MLEKHNDSTILDRIGSTGYIAQKLDLDDSTISCWRRRGVPRQSRKTLALMFPKVVPESWRPPKGIKRK